MADTIRSSDQIAREIIKRPADQWLDEQYIIYALYVIRSRALVGRDGMKPVNRRLIWSMFTSGILPTSQFVKAAQIVGNTTGVFHPHGTAPVAGAIARMAQDFSMRVPLIDYMGSVGFVTGDAPASERYWEARLTKAAVELVRETKEGGVDFGKNFDGKVDEPMELPSRWPADIINGSEGIAVGFAANMVPHNPTEVMNAAKAYLKNPEITVKQLMRHMKGPDFPTGGELIGIEGIKDYYETGKGRFNIRGRYRIEDMSRGRKRVIFYELPFQVSAESIRADINRIQNNGGMKGIAVARDSTDRKNGLRLVIETKAGSNHLSVINEIFKSTKAEVAISVNNTVLQDDSPECVGILELLGDFIDLRTEVSTRMSENRLESCTSRKHQLDAILAALVDIDKAISIIRSSDTAASAKSELMGSFKLDETQADYILSMQLRRLTKADSIELQDEKDKLDREIAHVQKRLDNPEVMQEYLLDELEATKKVISDPRRTIISGMTADDAAEAAKEAQRAAKAVEKNSPCFITRFDNGTLLMTSKEFKYDSNAQTFEKGLVVEQIKVKTQDSLVLVATDGTGYRIPVSYINSSEPSTPKSLGLDLEPDEFVGVAKDELGTNDVGLSMVTRSGAIKISKTDWPTKESFPVFTLDEGDEIVGARWLGRSVKSTFFAIGSSDGNVLAFPADSIRVAGSRSGGVKGMKLKEGAEVLGFNWVRSVTASDTFVVTFTGKSMKLTPISLVPAKNKGGMGVAVHTFRKGEEKLKAFYVGTNPAITVGDEYEAISLPAASMKRNGPSTHMTLPVTIGASETEVL